MPTHRTFFKLALAAPLALALAACGGEAGGDLEGDVIAPIAAPAGTNWSETVTVSAEDGYILGNPEAPIKLIEYASHTCGSCANFAATGKPAVKEYVATGVVSFDQTAAPFAEALTAWAAAAGSDTTPVTIVNDVTFEACSRGNSAAEPPTPVIAPLSALLVERDVLAFAGSNPSAAEIADYQCVAATMIDDPLLAPILLLETLDANQQALFAWQSTIAANDCGVPPLMSAP